MLTTTRVFAMGAALSGLAWTIALGTIGGLGGAVVPLVVLALVLALTLWNAPPRLVVPTIALAWLGGVLLVGLLLSGVASGAPLVAAALLYGTLTVAGVLVPAGIAAALYRTVIGRPTP